MNTRSIIREPVVDGTFYPLDRSELEKTVLTMLGDSGCERLEGDIRGIISPHAGYVYSGEIAAEAYNQIRNKRYENVIIIAPSHFEYFEGCSVVYGDYKTPVGAIETHIEMAEAIVSKSSFIKESTKGHMREHSLEVQLPFLQIALGNFKLIPVVMGSQDYSTAEDLSNSIFAMLSDPRFSNKNILVVGSSDLSHYHPVERAKEMDGIVIKDIEDFDEKKLFDDISSKKCEACGYGPMITTMMISKKIGANRSRILSYGTSGDISNDFSSVVGYLSSIFYNTQGSHLDNGQSKATIM